MESPIEENLPELCITTLFCTANLGCTVNLRKICQKRWNIEYCHRRSFATLRIRNPMATAQIYQSGKMIVSGVRSESEGRMVVRKFARIVQKTDTDCQVKLGIFKVRNIVGYYHFDFKSIIELSELAHRIGKSTCYEPELTPNHLTYYPLKERQIAVSVYAKRGYVKISGGKSMQEMKQIFRSVHGHLVDYKRFVLVRQLMNRNAQLGEKRFALRHRFKSRPSLRNVYKDNIYLRNC